MGQTQTQTERDRKRDQLQLRMRMRKRLGQHVDCNCDLHDSNKRTKRERRREERKNDIENVVKSFQLPYVEVGVFFWFSSTPSTANPGILRTWTHVNQK